jgi:hypothetical protein
LPKHMADLDLDDTPPAAGEKFDCREQVRRHANVESILAAVRDVWPTRRLDEFPRFLGRRHLREDIDRVVREYNVFRRLGPQQPRDELRRAYAGLAGHAKRIRKIFKHERMGKDLVRDLAPLFPAYVGQSRPNGGREAASSLATLRATLRRLERLSIVRSSKAPKSPKAGHRRETDLEWLLGTGLRKIFERWFRQPAKVSQSRTIRAGEKDYNAPPKGPYIDFALAVLREKRIRNSDGSPIAHGTVYVAVQHAKAAEKRSKTRKK